MREATGRPEPKGVERFVAAQQGSYPQAIAELRDGCKRSHWMWYVFPQLAGLGHSEMARRYAIRDLDEARSYLAHPILGPRLLECCEVLLALPAAPITTILGHPDELKLRSSMTLFEQADPAIPLFAAVLERYFAGERDPLTLERFGIVG